MSTFEKAIVGIFMALFILVSESHASGLINETLRCGDCYAPVENKDVHSELFIVGIPEEATINCEVFDKQLKEVSLRTGVTVVRHECTSFRANIVFVTTSDNGQNVLIEVEFNKH